MYFKMEKLNEKITGIKEHSLSVICAPRGSGKTSVLTNKLRDLGIRYIWFNLTKEQDGNHIWQEILKEINVSKIEVGCTMPILKSEIRQFNDILADEYNEYIYIVLNNYNDNDLGVLNNYISSFDTDNVLRFIIVANKITDSNVLDCIYSDKCLWIDTSYFRVTASDVKLTAESNQIALSKSEIIELLDFSGGWLIAVNLCLQAYKQSGSIYSVSTLYDYIDTVLLKDYPREVKKDLAKLTIVEEFSIELAMAICKTKEAIEFILENEMDNIIFRKTSYNKYFFSNMLKDFFMYYLNKYESNTIQLYKDAGQWYISNNLPTKAIAVYLKGQLFEEIIELLRSSENSYMDMIPSLIQEVYRKIPQELNRKYPYIYLRYISDCMTNVDQYNGVRLLEKFKIDLDNGKYGGDNKQLEGEYYYIRAFSKFNDVSEMMKDFHLAYDCFNGGKSMVAYQNMVATFGSCHMLYLYHKEAGKLFKVVKEIQKEVGYFVHISHGVNAGGSKLIEAEYNYETGNYDASLGLTRAAYQEANLSKQTSICIASLFLEARYMLLKKEYTKANRIIDKLSKMKEKTDLPILIGELECALGYLNVLIGNYDNVSKWIKDLELKDSGLLHEAASQSYVISMLYNLYRRKYDNALMFSEYIENYCEHQMHVFGLIYAKLGKVIANHHLGNYKEALINFNELVLLASKDKIKTIFIENRSLIKPLFESYFKDNSYFKTIRGLNEGDDINDKFINSSLTQKEVEVIKAFIMCDTVQSTADKLCISKNTVKTHLRKAYSKLGVSSKGELVKMSVDDNKTVIEEYE